MRILLVEDDEKLARWLHKGLEEERHSVSVAHTEPDELHLSQTHSFDVIVLDVMLPGMNGIDIAKRLRQTNRRTPILMLTARDAPADVINGLDLGADDYLTKPFDFEVLLSMPLVLAIATADGYWMSRRALARVVDEITRAAHLVREHNLSSRLPIPAAADELQRLTLADHVRAAAPLTAAESASA